MDVRFAIMTDDGFYKEDGSICLFTLRQVKVKMKELKSMGYEVSAIPYCD